MHPTCGETPIFCRFAGARDGQILFTDFGFVQTDNWQLFLYVECLSQNIQKCINLRYYQQTFYCGNGHSQEQYDYEQSGQIESFYCLDEWKRENKQQLNQMNVIFVCKASAFCATHMS